MLKLTPFIWIVLWLLCITDWSMEQAVSDLFIGGGKVVILNPETSLNITNLKALEVYIKNVNPVYIQIWLQNSDTNFTLEWQVRLERLPIFGLNLVDFDESQMFPLSPDHRLGIYNIRDPGPIPYHVTEQGMAVLSESSFTSSSSPAVSESHTFSTLYFPYTFDIRLCNYTGCLSYEKTTTPEPSSTPTNKPTSLVNVVDPGATSHPLMSGTFLVVLLVWLIVVTFVVITVIIVIIYLNARSSGAITRAAEDKSSNVDPDGDWYIVVQDTSQAQKVLSS